MVNEIFSHFITLETTVITGFEAISAQECEKINNVLPEVKQGRLKFNISFDQVPQVFEMRSIENIFLILYSEKNSDLNSKEKLDKMLDTMTDDINWEYHSMVLHKIKELIKAKYVHFNTNITATEKEPDNSKEENSHLTKFRVSCNRNGDNHNFQSNEAAAMFGGYINDKLGWKPDMTKFDIEVILNINHDLIQVCFPITIKCLSDRNISHFGPTTLKSTICHNLLSYAQPQIGEIICDPLCGGGSIAIEGSLCWPECLYLCGDSHEKALLRTQLNIEHLSQKLCADILPYPHRKHSSLESISPLRWDATRMPVRESCIDVFVTDAPFGKRIGTRNMNRTLYPKLLLEMARACAWASGRGRAVILTKDVTAMSLALKRTKDYWKLVRFFHANIGGLKGTIYLLSRLQVSYSTFVVPPVHQDTHDTGSLSTGQP